ncbi:hypothetical protein SPSIL_017070 [Sporomusa silvacetica DSM 10669]|uniref:Homeodomain phBC6A51-type domain-containing protein n=1 Tax=Sporomusa silvacetica DSM 10669 TaxID=1123289 RepID=A0ABZ3IIP8_9FIRM|nr:hypothetical protein [Sporomusa silvacetica]OZC18360.1 hypothetical protein SPSIL_25600 [Sporomusa silvacetica DSM 10669]
MAGGSKVDKHESLIIALLSSPDIQTAAAKACVSESTAWRWLREDEEFQTKYKAAKKQALSVAIAQLQQAAGEAVKTLRDVAAAADSPASSRVSAAKSILELAIKAAEIEEIEQRLSELEAQIKERGK